MTKNQIQEIFELYFNPATKAQARSGAVTRIVNAIKKGDMGVGKIDKAFRKMSYTEEQKYSAVRNTIIQKVKARLEPAMA